MNDNYCTDQIDNQEFNQQPEKVNPGTGLFA